MKALLYGIAVRAVLTVSVATGQQTPLTKPIPTHQEIVMQMRDGVKLAASVFLPEGKGPWPVVVDRTLYDKNSGYLDMVDGGSEHYTSHGIALVLQDVRGKGHSEVFFSAFSDDIPDGYDTIEWLAKQPWCNGRVGIRGTSAQGITANAAAIAAPAHLVAAYTEVAPQDRSAFEYPGGVLKQSDAIGWGKAWGISAADFKHVYDGVVDNVFDHRDGMSQGLQDVRIPIFNVGGWFDIFGVGNVDNFTWLQNQGSSGARGNQKLYMGPFGHGPLNGDIDWPGSDSMSATSIKADEIRWWEYWLKGIHNGIMDEPPVQLYMMASARKGALSPKNRILTLGNWPPASRAVRYYPTETHSLSTDPPTATEAKISYQFDPAQPVPTVGGNNITLKRGPMDQRAIRPRPDYLRFETPSLDKDVVIAGHVSVEVWAATDGPDTDFMAKLIDVYPDGYEALVLDEPIRTRYRNGRLPDQIRMMTPGAPEKLSIDMWNTAITFEKGHHIELVITSSNAPRFEVNRNNGALSGDTTTPARVATNTVYMDKEHPTTLVLPLIYPEDTK